MTRNGTVTTRTLIAAVLYAAWVPALVAAQAPTADSKKDEPTSKVGKRLIRETAEGAGADVMDEIMHLMNDVGRLLEIKFDPGPDTQAMQQEIVDRLDDAIKTAAKQRRRSRQQAAPSGDKRTRKEPSEGKPGQAKATKAKDAESSSDDQATASSAKPKTDPVTGELLETRRSWGNLPQRDRDEVIQGSDEACLQRYRELIERYYRALQETKK